MARYLDALPSQTYTVAVGQHSGGSMQRREFTADQVMQALPWLARENARGKDIYIRPAENGYVLVDDLKSEGLEKLKKHGLAPAVVTETSPGNHQAWVSLGEHLSDREASAAARILAQGTGGDRGSASYEHLGRLPGFTNQKPQHTQANGFQPFVLVRQAVRQVAERAGELIQSVRARLADADHKKAMDQRLEDARAGMELPAPRPGRRGRKPQDAFRAVWARAEEKSGGDHSRADFVACQRMLVAGYRPSEVAQAVEECSPALTDRKADPADYARRTVEKASESQWVQEQQRLKAKTARAASQERVSAAGRLAEASGKAPELPTPSGPSFGPTR